jgi:hypothetical protein
MARWSRAGAIMAVLVVSGCSWLSGGKSDNGDSQTVYTSDDPYHYNDPRDYNPKIQSPNDPGVTTLMASMFSGDKGKGDGEGGGGGGGAGVGVNGFLWRASLDTVRFMPLASADPFGGVIITDWYSPPQTPDERFKANIYILGRELRADGVRVSVFHQKRDAGGQWIEASVDANTGTDIENAILMRAREMRLSAAQQ